MTIYYNRSPNSISNRILETLEDRNHTRDELAVRIGTYPSTITKWITDGYGPNANQLIDISKFLDVPIVYLLTGKGTNERAEAIYNKELTIYEKNILTAFRNIKDIRIKGETLGALKCTLKFEQSRNYYVSNEIDDPTEETLIERINKMLKRRKYTKIDLANYIGVSPSLVTKWASCSNRLPSINVIFKICEFLDVSIDYLYTGKEKNLKIEFNEALSVYEEELITCFRLLNIEQKGLLSGTLNYDARNQHERILKNICIF